MTARSKNKRTADEIDADDDDEGQQTPPNGDGKDGDGDDAGDRKFTQEELNDIVSERLKKEKTRIKREIADEIRAELQEEIETEEAEKTGDLQKLLDKANKKIEKLEETISEYEGNKAAEELEKLKISIAKSEGLPESAYEHVKGDDEDSIKASVAGLAQLLGVREAPDGDQGKTKKAGSRRRSRDDDDERPDFESVDFWRQEF